MEEENHEQVVMDGSFELEDDGFEAMTELPTDGEVALPISTNYQTYKKLEVVSSREVNSMARNFNIMAFLSFVASAIVIVLARTTFSMTSPALPGFLPALTFFNFPGGFALADSIAAFLLFAYSVFLFLLYISVLAMEGRGSILAEQVWVILLLLNSVIYLNPYDAAIRLRRDFLGLEVPSFGEGFSYVDVFTCIRMTSFSGISILYLWVGAHGYRYLESRVSFRDWQVYLPKIVVVVLYNAYKLFVLFKYRVTFSELQFASFVGFLNLYARVGLWPMKGVLTVSILTFLEISMLTWIGFDIWKTHRNLKEAEYTKHRSKILGFKFFLHQQVVFYLVYSMTYVMLLFGLPEGIQITLFMISGGDGTNSYFDIQYAPVGLPLCILAFTTIEAYTNLPASVTLKNNWIVRKFRRQTETGSQDGADELLLQPIYYRNKEPPSFPGTGASILPNCFIMQTHIEMFNLSWFTYYHGTRKEKSVKVDLKDSGLKIRTALHDERTDTNVLVIESEDRIIFAFKGTASRQNLSTDIKVTHRSLSNVVEGRGVGGEFGGRENSRYSGVVRSKKYRQAKIHAGFAEAYSSVQDELREVGLSLLEEKERPLYFTGHSLGGALATIASIDVALWTGTGGENIVASTFGSPRVGSRAFQELYDREIGMNWRFVAGGDIISRLPKLGYSHVGKQVVLTSTGQLFIDPNALEMLFWHSQPASVVHHRKSCYMLALKAWCQSRSSTYVPHFWHFPISSHDTQRFQNSFRTRPTSFPTSMSFFQTKPTLDRRAKLRLWANQIDQLDDAAILPTLPLWERLAKPLVFSIRDNNHII